MVEYTWHHSGTRACGAQDSRLSVFPSRIQEGEAAGGRLCRMYEELSTGTGTFLVNLNKKPCRIYVKNTIAKLRRE